VSLAAGIAAPLAAQVAAEAARSAAPREFAFSHKEFDAIVRILRAEAGIDMPAAKEPLVYSRLAKRVRALGLSGFSEYVALVSDPAAPERSEMLAALTTNVTRFFREPHHFEDLRQKTLPPLMARARAGGRVRIWSAGCSTGMEPYSIALCVLDVAPEASNWDVRILATDINPKVLAEGRAGRYPADALRDAPQPLVKRWFADAPDGRLQASDALRRLIVFNELNLMGQWPMKGPFDVIFCRNVAIYFDEPTQCMIWERLAKLLAIGGRLNIGHSERIAGPAAAMLESDGVTAYTRV
jgi:chemotaxis protein methyltransferase CheR